ncbi:MAG: hypothetical protein JWN10_205 [Solirubrobacterales bacterium]|nr:hypothetical protein [Solirubrobacterales bacterium]
MIGLRRIEELQAEARYHRERYELYKAKAYGPRLTSPTRLMELERRHQGADSRLRSAEHENAHPATLDEADSE